MRRLRPTVRRLQRLMRRRGVGAGVVVTAASAAAITAWLFRGAPPLDEEAVAPPVEMVIDLLQPWTLHTIVAGGQGAGQPDGADGVALADVDGDGLLDVVTGHEQGLRITLSFNPGPALVTSPWPTVILPSVNMCSAEDAQFADVDADGGLDIIAGCETGTGLVEIYFHPGPGATRATLLNAANWTRVRLTNAVQRSMRVAAVDIAGDSALEIVVGGKENNCGTPPVGEADVGYYSSATPRTGASWTFTEIAPVGWTQQMYVIDLDVDGDLDIVYSDYDRIDCPAIDNSRRGVRWLDSDGADPPAFTERQISTVEGNHRWFSLYDADGDGDFDILDCESLSGPPPTSELRWLINGGGALSWSEVALPTVSSVGSCIDTEIADYDQDGQLDIAVSYSHAENASGMVWLKRAGATFVAATYERGEIAGILDADSDVKFDNILATDVDGDGDLDLVTSEQHIPDGTGPGLGVLWAKNPLAPADPGAGGDDTPADDGGDEGGGGGPIACAPLTSGNGTASTTAVTASVTPTADAVVYAAFISSLAGGPAAPTGVTGNGLTWAQEETVTFHTGAGRRLTVFRAQGAAPSAGTVTATWADPQTSFQWVIVECTGADTTGTSGSGATVQSTTNTASAATSVTGTLAALAGAGSAHLAFSGISINNSQTADAAFAELADTSIGTGASGLMAQWAIGETTTTPTFATANAGIISIEVR